MRIPVKAVAVREQEPETEQSAGLRGHGTDQLDLSAVFSSAVFERVEQEENKKKELKEEGIRLPEKLAEPVRQLNKLADTCPEPDELPRYFDPRRMSEEEENKAYIDPVRLVDPEPKAEAPADTKPKDKAPAPQAAPSDGGTRGKEAKKSSGRGKGGKKKSAKNSPEDNCSTEELLETIERQQQDKKVRDLEQAELKRARDRERARRAEEERAAARDTAPGSDEISRREDTLFMWWSELDSRDGDAPEDTDSSEAFTQMQITDDIPDHRSRPRAPVREVTEEDAAEIASAVDRISEFAADIVPDDKSVLSDNGYAGEDYDDDYGDVSFEDGEDDDTSVNVRYFDRGNDGERVEVERSAAVGQEVVVIDNESGKMKRICGIIKRGQAAQPDGDAEDGAGEGKPGEDE